MSLDIPAMDKLGDYVIKIVLVVSLRETGKLISGLDKLDILSGGIVK